MTTLHRGRSGVIACSKGAPEAILVSCTRARAAYGTMALNEATHHAVHKAVQAMAARALRVLAVAQKPNADIGDAECEMVFLGLIGLIDPPRAAAVQAIETCKAAGIRPVMITGDHPNTGAAIAKEISLLEIGACGDRGRARGDVGARARRIGSRRSRSTRASRRSTSCGWCGPGSRRATSWP